MDLSLWNCKYLNSMGRIKKEVNKQLLGLTRLATFKNPTIACSELK
jgi:hypothetical protein